MKTSLVKALSHLIIEWSEFKQIKNLEAATTEALIAIKKAAMDEYENSLTGPKTSEDLKILVRYKNQVADLESTLDGYIPPLSEVEQNEPEQKRVKLSDDIW
jgi:hypothetical protein